MIYLAQIDISSEGIGAIRTKFGQTDMVMRKEQDGLFHLFRPGYGHVASFFRMGILANGDRIFVVMSNPRVVTYMINKLGARFMAWEDAATSTQNRAILGGISLQNWLLAHGGVPFSDPDYPTLAGIPLPPITIGGFAPHRTLTKPPRS